MRNSLSTLPAVAVVACSVAVSALHASSLEEIRQTGRLHVAVYSDYAPFADGGQGIDVDVATALAKKLGVSAEIRAYPDGDSIEGDLRNIHWRGHHLWRGHLADVMMHVPVDPNVIRKNDQVRIFAPYFRERIVIARNRTRIPLLPDLRVFTSEKIGVEAETLEDRYLVSSYSGLLRENVVHFKTLAGATAALVSGGISAVMGRQSLVEAGLGTHSPQFEISAAPAPGLAATGWEVGLAVKADNPELATTLDQAMAELRRDGTIERIFTQRGLTYAPPKTMSSP